MINNLMKHRPITISIFAIYLALTSTSIPAATLRLVVLNDSYPPGE